jgi:cytochrome P450
MLSDVVFKIFNIVINNFFSLIALTIVSYVINFYINYFNRPAQIPGPLPLPIIGNLHQIGSDLAAALDRFHEKYGDFYEFYAGNIRNVVISRPDLAEKVWGPTSIKTTKFIMRNAPSVGVDELGLGTKGIVLNRDIESWNINRKCLIQSTSSKPFLREAIKLVSKVSDEIFEYWQIMEKKGIQVEFHDWMTALGTDIVITTATGKRVTSTADLFNKSLNFNEKNSKTGIWNNGLEFTNAIYTYNESMMFMMMFAPFIRRNFPGIKNLNNKFLDNRDWINNELKRLIAERRKEVENTPLDQPLTPTILTLLITTNTERDLDKINLGKFDRPLMDEELSSILREVFTGGLDTTSNTLSITAFYLAKNRDVYLKMRQEVLDVYGTLDNPDLTIESFEKLKYIEAVIHESIRMFPTLGSMPRAAVEDVDFDGITIKADTTVYTNFKVMSHNPKYFKDPERFNPDRFIIDKEPTIRMVYFPFGSGVRMCPGRVWAFVQMKTFLVKLVSTFDIELVNKNADIKYVYATAVRAVDINLYVKPRKN